MKEEASMPDEQNTTETPEQNLKQSLTDLVTATEGLVRATSHAEQERDAFGRQEAREDRRLAAFEREVELYAAEAARVQAHRERIEQIEQERNKHFASMAESLGAIAKKVLERS